MFIACLLPAGRSHKSHGAQAFRIIAQRISWNNYLTKWQRYLENVTDFHFLLWGYVKLQVFQYKTRTIHNIITRTITNFRDMWERQASH